MSRTRQSSEPGFASSCGRLTVKTAREHSGRKGVSAVRLLVAGDTHGNLDHAAYLAHEAQRLGCDAIFQVGDWGYTWPETNLLSPLTKLLRRAGVPMYFIDGNHENFPDLAHRGLLRATAITPLVSAAEEPVVFYVPRGHLWVWEGTRFMAMGGAVSIDQASRVEGVSWWRDEAITQADLDRAARNLAASPGPVDVFISHDAPSGISYIENWVGMPMDAVSLLSRGNREALRTAVEAARPALLLHGHYHVAYHDELALSDGTVVQVRGLDSDQGQRTYMVLDLPLG
ncbi:MAG: metallophosphoesterase family protein [Actinomycetota bacterium]